MGFLLPKSNTQLSEPPKASTPIIDQIGTSPEDERRRRLAEAAKRKGYQQSLLAGKRTVPQTLGAPAPAAEGVSLLGGR